MARQPIPSNDWLGAQFGLAPILTVLIGIHILALFIWIVLLIRGSRPAAKFAGKQH